MPDPLVFCAEEEGREGQTEEVDGERRQRVANRQT